MWKGSAFAEWETNRTWNWLDEENRARQEGYRCIVGIDEAGRGALAGPVVAACIVLPEGWIPPGLNDSKALSADQRETLYEALTERARGYGIGMVEAAAIDEINILQATHRAMRLALENLPFSLFADLALIDGYPVQPFPIDQVALVQGDGRCASIAAASILAKVTRDRMMRACAALYPDYRFEANKGYGAPDHLRALRAVGPCPLHRRTFRPVAESITKGTQLYAGQTSSNSTERKKSRRAR
jgi:ribonuclease HII